MAEGVILDTKPSTTMIVYLFSFLSPVSVDARPRVFVGVLMTSSLVILRSIVPAVVPVGASIVKTNEDLSNEATV
jgi:hypothetical protein